MEIKLTNGLMTAAVNSFGAELKSLRDSEGREYLWDGGNPDYWNRSAPFLFPIVGALRGGKVLVGGKECQMPQHGFCRNMEWTLAVQSPFSATFTLADTPETFSTYPFHFQLALKYTLVGRTIRMEFEVSNAGTEEMLFCFGTHPAIRVPFDGSDSDFSDYSVRFNRPETAKSPLYDKSVGAIDLANRRDFMRDSQTLDLDYSVFEEVDTIIFDQANSDAVTLLDNRTGKEVEIRYQNLSMIAFWTPKAGAPFLCVEPWQGCAVTADADDRFESKLGVQRLAPYTAKTFTLEIEAK